MNGKGPETYPRGLRTRNPDSKRPLQGQEMDTTRSQTLRSKTKTSVDPEDRLKDLPPTGGLINTTTRHGAQTEIPSVGQYTLEGDQIPVDKIQTTHGMQNPQPKDALTQGVPDGTPPPKAFRKANAQMWAITRETLRRAKKKQKK